MFDNGCFGGTGFDNTSRRYRINDRLSIPPKWLSFITVGSIFLHNQCINIMHQEMLRLNYRIKLILVADALLLVLGMLGTYRTAIKANLPADLKLEQQQVVVQEITDPELIVLRPGDVIRSVSGQSIATSRDVEFLTDHLVIGASVSLEIEREGTIGTIDVPLVKFYSPRYLLIQSLVGGLYFFLGILVLLKKYGERVATVFHWVSVSVGVMVMTTWASYTIKPLGLGHAVQLTDLLANAAIPVLFVHLGFVFPREKLLAARKLLPILYIVSTGFLILMASTFLQACFPPLIDGYHRFLVVFNIFRLFFCGCVIVGMANFLHSYFTNIEEPERRKLRWVILGLIGGPLGFILLWAIPYVILSRSLVTGEIIVLISAITPTAFAISIVRYRIMDIDLIFNRGTVYIIVLGVLLTVYALVVGMVAVLIGTFTVRASLIASGAAAVVIALIFEPTRRLMQRLVDRTFFRVRYDYREALRQFADELTGCVDIQQLANLIVDRIDSILQPERIGFYIVGDRDRHPVLLAHKNEGGFIETDNYDKLDILKACSGLPLVLDDKIEPGVPHEPANPDIFNKRGIALILPIPSERFETLGLLVLGPKKSGARFNVEDIDLINTVANQTGMALARITLQHQLLLEQAETQRLEELNQLKSYFVSSVSHELKTPLTSIRMFAELLQKRKKIPSADMREYLEIIQGESERLARLIENVLDFAKVERGVKEYHFTSVDLNELVRKVLKSLEYQLKMQQIQVQLELDKQVSAIQADPEAVIESLMNLLSNAMKYSTDRKEVTVATFQRNGFAGVSVGDQGSGIAPDELEHIFDPFYRVKVETRRQTAGTGLGLTLVKHIMDAHKGKIEVHSKPGKGSRFTLLFPQEEDRETHTDR